MYKMKKVQKNSRAPAISIKKENRVKQQMYKTEWYKNLKNAKNAKM